MPPLGEKNPLSGTCLLPASGVPVLTVAILPLGLPTVVRYRAQLPFFFVQALLFTEDVLSSCRRDVVFPFVNLTVSFLTPPPPPLYVFGSCDMPTLLLVAKARGKGDMIHKFQKFIALFFFLWWTLGAGESEHPPAGPG